MINRHTVLALVPARGGSKRIPHKNMKELGGKPLIAHTFEEIHKSSYIDRTIVATDDDQVISLAHEYGIETPFKEPDALAGDDIKDLDFFSYFLEELERREGYAPDIIVQLRPTSPLRSAKHIDAAVELLAQHPEADSVRTVMEPEQSPYKMYAIGEEGYLEPLLTIPGVSESFNLPGAMLPRAYKHVGYVDVMWRRTIMKNGKMTGENVLPLIVPDAHSGINTPEDWERYEYLFQRRSV